MAQARNSANPVNAVALALVIIGGINWLLVGVADFNLVSWIFGAQSTISRIVYIIVGIAALYCLSLFGPVTSRNRIAVDEQYAADRPRR